MKKTALILFLFFGFYFQMGFSILKAQMPEAVPIDKEHVEIYQTVVLSFLDKNFIENKEYADGDLLEQKIDTVDLLRVDSLPSGLDRYVVIIALKVKRFNKEIEQFTEESLLQVVYFDVKDNKEVFDFFPHETIDSQFMNGEFK